MNTFIVIPARKSSTRMLEKPLVDIHGKPMIVRVWEKAVACQLGPVIVACCCEDIKEVIHQVGGIAIVTPADLPSGTDRVAEAVKIFDPKKEYEIVVNLQCDLPTINPNDLKRIIEPFARSDVDISTLAAPIKDKDDVSNPNVVKVAISHSKGLYFSRSAIPYGAKTYYHHIGVYGYRRKALEKFASLSPSPLEESEKLEQLRALEERMSIGVVCVDNIPQSVDVQEDLKKVRQAYAL